MFILKRSGINRTPSFIFSPSSKKKFVLNLNLQNKINPDVSPFDSLHL